MLNDTGQIIIIICQAIIIIYEAYFLQDQFLAYLFSKSFTCVPDDKNYYIKYIKRGILYVISTPLGINAI